MLTVVKGQEYLFRVGQPLRFQHVEQGAAVQMRRSEVFSVDAAVADQDDGKTFVILCFDDGQLAVILHDGVLYVREGGTVADAQLLEELVDRDAEPFQLLDVDPPLFYDDAGASVDELFEFLAFDRTNGEEDLQKKQGQDRHYAVDQRLGGLVDGKWTPARRS